jgi:hypothetical protein
MSPSRSDDEFCPDCGQPDDQCTCGTATWCPICGCEPDDPNCTRQKETTDG